MSNCTIPLKEIVQSGYHLNIIINNKPNCIFCERKKEVPIPVIIEEEEIEPKEEQPVKVIEEIKEKSCLKCAEYLKQIEELENKIAEYLK